MPPRTTIIQQVLLLAVFGVWIPMQKGVAFLEPVFLGAYACLGVVFAAPSVAAGKSVLDAVRSGLLLSWAVLITGIATVYLTRSVVVGPNLSSLAECGLFGLTLSLAACQIVAYAQSKLVARLLLLGLLALFYFEAARLPDVALEGAAACAVIAAGFMIWKHANRTPV